MTVQQCFCRELITKSFDNYTFNMDLKKKKKGRKSFSVESPLCHSHGAQLLGAQLVADNSSLAEKPNPRQDVAVPLQSSASCRTQQASRFA